MNRRWAALALILGLLVAMASGTPAFAHDTQVATQPKDGEVLADPPARVVVEFDARIMDVGEALVVRSADGVVVSTGAPEVSGRSLSTSVRTDVPPGEYTVAYRIVSQDGHPITATFRYVVEGASTGPDQPEAEASATATGSTAVASPAAGLPASSGAPSTADSGGADDPPYLLIGIGIVVLLALVIGALALSR